MIFTVRVLFHMQVDGLRDHLERTVDAVLIRKVQRVISENCYDSEAIVDDVIGDLTESNISSHVQFYEWCQVKDAVMRYLKVTIDLWSLGVIIYEMVANDLPFVEQMGTMEVRGLTLLEVMRTQKVNVDDLGVGMDCKELLVGLLMPNKEDRSWDLLRKNRWLQ